MSQKTFEIQSPSGKTYEIQADNMPSGAQLQAIIMQMEPRTSKQVSPDEQALMRFGGNPDAVLDVGKRFAGGVGESLNPVSIIKGIGGMIAHPIDNIVAPMVVNRVKADEADKQGRTSEAMAYRAGGMLPLIGPAAVQIGEDIGETGDVARGVGRATGMILGGKAVEALPSGASMVAKGARAAAPIAGDVAKGVARATVDPATSIAAAAGEVIAGHKGAAIGGLTVGALKAIPEVWKAVKNGIMERKGISGAQAEAEIVKMTPEARAMEVEAVTSKAPPKLEGETFAGYMQRTGKQTPQQIAAAQMAYKAERMAKRGGYAGGGEIKPIPPSKLTPEVVETKPVTMRETAAKKAEAAKEVVEAKPAFKGQQGAKGATQARFKDVAKRTVTAWIKDGKSDAFISDKLRNMFKMDPDEAADLIREIGGK